MQKHNQKILICLSGPLLEEIDRARSEKQLSRSAFIRESVICNLLYYNEHERDFLCFLHAQAEVNTERPSRDRDETCEEVRQRSSEAIRDHKGDLFKLFSARR